MAAHALQQPERSSSGGPLTQRRITRLNDLVAPARMGDLDQSVYSFFSSGNFSSLRIWFFGQEFFERQPQLDGPLTSDRKSKQRALCSRDGLLTGW